MERINAPGAVNGLFQNGNPFTTPKIPATLVVAKWLTDLQEEAMSVIEGAGLTPDANDRTQLYQAIGAICLEATGGVGGGPFALANGTAGVLPFDNVGGFTDNPANAVPLESPTIFLNAPPSISIDTVGNTATLQPGLWQVRFAATYARNNTTGGLASVAAELVDFDTDEELELSTGAAYEHLLAQALTIDDRQSTTISYDGKVAVTTARTVQMRHAQRSGPSGEVDFGNARILFQRLASLS